jgi:hypothetical protein
MMHRSKFLSGPIGRIFIPSLILAALAGGQDKPVSKIVLEEVLSIGNPDDDRLYQWTGVAADDQGGIYVLDAIDASLKKFDAQGHLVGRTGRKGQGPGEFGFPVLLALEGDRLYVADQGRLGIQVFDRSLNFLKSIPQSRPINLLRAHSQGRLAIKAMAVPGSAARLTVVDGDGRAVSEFVFLDKVEAFLADSVSVVFDAAGNSYLAYLHQDRIEKRDPQGRLMWVRTPRGGASGETEIIRDLPIASKLFSLDIAIDPQGRLFVLEAGATPHPGRDVLVFGAEGGVLASLILPDPSHCLYIDGRGFLYARADEGVTLKKYRILFP